MIRTLIRKLGFRYFNNAGYSLHHVNSGFYLKHEDKFRLKTYKALFSDDILSKKPFYNVGAGSFYHPYWTNIDYKSDWYNKVQNNILEYDLMSLGIMPIHDNAAKIIYSSHTIEHVEEKAVQNFFCEAFRCLEPGGLLRITTGPDADTDYSALQRDDQDWFYWDVHEDRQGHLAKPLSEAGLAERWLHHVATPLSPLSKTPSKKKYQEKEIRSILKEKTMNQSLDFFTSQCFFNKNYAGDHISWWSYDKLSVFLKNAGFKTVCKSGYRQSVSPLLRQSELFDSTHPQISVYVEAFK